MKKTILLCLVLLTVISCFSGCMMKKNPADEESEFDFTTTVGRLTPEDYQKFNHSTISNSEITEIPKVGKLYKRDCGEVFLLVPDPDYPVLVPNGKSKNQNGRDVFYPNFYSTQTEIPEKNKRVNIFDPQNVENVLDSYTFNGVTYELQVSGGHKYEGQPEDYCCIYNMVNDDSIIIGDIFFNYKNEPYIIETYNYYFPDYSFEPEDYTHGAAIATVDISPNATPNEAVNTVASGLSDLFDFESYKFALVEENEVVSDTKGTTFTYRGTTEGSFRAYKIYYSEEKLDVADLYSSTLSEKSRLEITVFSDGAVTDIRYYPCNNSEEETVIDLPFDLTIDELCEITTQTVKEHFQYISHTGLEFQLSSLKLVEYSELTSGDKNYLKFDFTIKSNLLISYEEYKTQKSRISIYVDIDNEYLPSSEDVYESLINW